MPSKSWVGIGAAAEDDTALAGRGEEVLFDQGRDDPVLRSAIRPCLPAPLAAPIALALGNRLVRRLSLPVDLPRALATHCAEEYANLVVLSPELYERFGSGRP